MFDRRYAIHSIVNIYYNYEFVVHIRHHVLLEPCYKCVNSIWKYLYIIDIYIYIYAKVMLVTKKKNSCRVQLYQQKIPNEKRPFRYFNELSSFKKILSIGHTVYNSN